MKTETEKVKIGPLTRSYIGYYEETLIQNGTHDAVVTINCHNNKIVIPPMSPTRIGRDCIVVWHRSAVGMTTDERNNPMQLDGTCTKISAVDLNTEGGVYLEDINMVLCTQAISITAEHPRSSTTYEEASVAARDEMIEELRDAPTVKLLANDPEGRYSKLYTVLGDILVSINVTNIYGEAELQIIAINDGQAKTYVVDLDKFFESAEEILELKDLPITFISTNKARAQRCANDYKRVPQSEVDDLLKKAQVKAAKDVAAIKDHYASDLTLKDNEINRLKDAVKNAENARDEAETKYKELKSAVDVDLEYEERRLKEKQMHAQSKISDNNKEISEQKTKDAKLDTVVKVATIASAVILSALKIAEVLAKKK